MKDMQSRHHEEIARIQSIANEAHVQAQQQLNDAGEKVRQLMGVVENQNRQLKGQRLEQEGLMAQVSMLQNEVTMLRHANTAVETHAQCQNGAVDTVELARIVESLQLEMRQSRNQPVGPVATPAILNSHARMGRCIGLCRATLIHHQSQ